MVTETSLLATARANRLTAIQNRLARLAVPVSIAASVEAPKFVPTDDPQPGQIRRLLTSANTNDRPQGPTVRVSGRKLNLAIAH